MVLLRCTAERPYCFLHVLKLSVQLFDNFRVFLLLLLNLVGQRLYKTRVQVHKSLNVLLLVFLLNNLVNGTHEISNSFFVRTSFRFFVQQLGLQFFVLVHASVNLHLQVLRLRSLNFEHFLEVEQLLF